MKHHFSKEIVRAIAEDNSLENFQILLESLLKSLHISIYKFVWLTEKRDEELWFENEYIYRFDVKKYFISFQDSEIALLYYKSDTEVKEDSIDALVIHCFLKFKKQDLNTQKSYIHQDLSLAAKMQQFLVPKNLYCNASFCASGLYIPNYQVGGDFYDVIPINDYKIGFCIGDISGKGINAAILMSYFIGFIRSTLLTNLNLEDTVRIINSKIYELTNGEKFITLFLGIYNVEDQRLVYINSGHVPIPLYHHDHLEWLETGTTILGAFQDLPFIDLGKIKINIKHHLFLYTDGLLNLNIDHKPFLSKSELSYLLQNECKDLNPHEISDYFRTKSKTISVEEELKDDISVLAISLGN